MTVENTETICPLHLIRDDIFTPHQARVVELLINGATRRQIAQVLVVTIGDVDNLICKKKWQGYSGIWERTAVATGEEITDITKFIRVLYKHHIAAFKDFTPPKLETPEQTQAFLESLQVRLAEIRQEATASFNFPEIPLERESVLV